MVFQDFALWPHMKVEDNITYGLKVGKVDPAECRKRVEEIAGLLHLDGLMSRYPAELSGGQQQRGGHRAGAGDQAVHSSVG